MITLAQIEARAEAARRFNYRNADNSVNTEMFDVCTLEEFDVARMRVDYIMQDYNDFLVADDDNTDDDSTEHRQVFCIVLNEKVVVYCDYACVDNVDRFNVYAATLTDYVFHISDRNNKDLRDVTQYRFYDRNKLTSVVDRLTMYSLDAY